MTKTVNPPEQKRVNGVDLTALHDTIKAVRQQPALGRSVFRLSNVWAGQALNRSTVGDFYVAGEERRHKASFVLENDEAEVLLGEDGAPNPVEFVLHALAGCITTATVYHAAARGIRVRRLETVLEGDLDLRGFLGISQEVPKGYQAIRATMTIDADADPGQIETLKQLFNFSPVFDTLTRAVPVDVQVHVQAKGDSNARS